MSEYIIRWDGIMDVLARGLRERWCPSKMMRELCISRLGDEVVRCRDCKHMRHGCWHFKYWDEVNGEYVPSTVSPDGFCSWAERKVDE